MRSIVSLVIAGLLVACGDDPSPTPSATTVEPAPVSPSVPPASAAPGGLESSQSDSRAVGAGGRTTKPKPGTKPVDTIAAEARTPDEPINPRPERDPTSEPPTSASDPASAEASPAQAVDAGDAANAALRARTRESKWNDFRAIVQKQADLMVKAGLARKKARQDPTPENQDAYNRVWGGIAPLAQKVSEYMSQPRFSEEDRAVMAVIIDEIQSKAMAQVEAAP